MQRFRIHRLYGIIPALMLSLLLVGTTGVWGADFNWRKYEGTTIRVLSGKSAFTPLIVKQIKEFEAATGIHVQEESYPSEPLRKKVLMELAAENKDLDVFQGLMKMAFQYEKAGWLQPLDGFIKDPALTSPDYDYDKDR